MAVLRSSADGGAAQPLGTFVTEEIRLHRERDVLADAIKVSFKAFGLFHGWLTCVGRLSKGISDARSTKGSAPSLALG